MASRPRSNTSTYWSSSTTLAPDSFRSSNRPGHRRDRPQAPRHRRGQGGRFSLDEARQLLATGKDGAPAYEQLRDLAARELPDVEALIDRAQAMRQWLTTATA